jgi:TonB family protein
MLEVPGRTTNYELAKARIFLGEEQQKPPTTVVTAPSTRPDHTVYNLALEGPQVSRLKATGRFQFKSLPLTVDLPMSDFTKLMEVVDYCVADLLATWGFSREQQARMATPPIRDKTQPFIRSEDYPDLAMYRGQVGQVQTRFTVHANGALSDCRIVQSSGHAALDETTCSSILSRAKYKPALDRNGKPMQAPMFVVVNWLQPTPTR